MKRELGSLAGAADVDAPRTKRRKELTGSTTQPAETNDAAEQAEGSSSTGQDGLKEQATRLWQMVKDAVNKECVTKPDGNICSPPFMRLPLKRHYPDYYHVIAQPICLDDIKKKIDDNHYPSLDEVRLDFELCFTNAKRYNIKESPIWLDAKFLLKLVNKEYTRITGKKAKKSSDPDDNGEEKVEVEGDDDRKKNKPPNMNRLLKIRLQKLVEKTDEETHRILSDVFMDMPSKKDYPTYYKEIKRPICIETIFKRLKRKEYTTSEEFANDVELVFSNALTFNLEHSQIWEDAVTLRDYFRQLMSDLPLPYSLPRYARSSGKIRLKVPGTGATTTVAPTTNETATSKLSDDQPTSSSSLTLRLPAAGSAAMTKNPVRALDSLPQASSTSTPVAPPAPTPASVQTPIPAPTTSTAPLAPTATLSTASVAAPKMAAPSPKVAVQPFTHTAAQYNHYPNAAYRQATQSVATPQPSTLAATPPVQQHTAHSVSRSPAPSLAGHRPLSEILILTKPRGRPFWLDHRDGVKSWAIRLGQGEGSLLVADVKFLGEDDRDSTDEETREEEIEEPAIKKRGRGRMKNSKAKVKSTPVKKSDHTTKKVSTPPHESIQIILNGTPVSSKTGEAGWEMELQHGSNVLEVGEKGGHVWKVYLEKPSSV
ncbi:RSC complex protein [Scleroderma citrinum]